MTVISGRLPVESVVGFFTAVSVAFVRFLVGVNTDMDLEAVGRQKGLPTA